MFAEVSQPPAAGGPSALIGHTGFVGGNLAAQATFTDRYRSTTIEEIAGREYELIVCAGAPGVKWKANRHPEQDHVSLRRLMKSLKQVHARRVILISTVDVYPEPRGVDESTTITPEAGHPYGRHRLELERFCAGHFDTLTIRLPGLFGPGLRKNIVFDFLTGNATDGINPDSWYQFYPLDRLWSDITVAVAASHALVNFATEPVSIRAVSLEVFGRVFTNPGAPPPATYDMQTMHGASWGSSFRYLMGREAVLRDMRAFVASQTGSAR